MIILRFALAALLIFAFASSAAAQTQVLSFAWSAYTSSGRAHPPHDELDFGHVTGYGLIRVTPTEGSDQIDIEFTGPGGSGWGQFRPDAGEPHARRGIVSFPARGNQPWEGFANAMLRAPLGAYGAGFTITGSAAHQGNVTSFTGAATPIRAALPTLLYGQNVSGTVTVGMAAGLANAPLTYELFIDSTRIFGQTVSAGTASASWNTRTVANGKHSVSFVVRDPESNAVIAGIAFPVIVSNTTPTALTASMTSPAAGATVSGVQPIGMAVSGAAPGTTTFTLRVDGTQVFSGGTSGTTMSFNWNTASVPNGSHALRLDVRDSANRTATTSRTVTVNNSAAPALKVTFTTPAQGATVSGTVWAHVWVEGQSGTSNTFTLSVGGRTVVTQTSSATHLTLAWDSRTVANGSHTITGTVRDATGKTGTATRTVTVGN